MASVETPLAAGSTEYLPEPMTIEGEGVPWWERNLPWLLVAPTLLLLVVFSLIPTVMLVRFAFSNVLLQRGGIHPEFIGFDNFARAFQDSLVQQAVWITLRWVVIVTACEILL